MISIFYKVPVSSTPQALWNILIEKVNQPEKYVTEVKSVEFKAFDEHRKLRIMDRQNIEVKEIIDVNEAEMTTRFELKDHPKYDGFIKNTIETNVDTCYLTYELQWEAHQGKDEFSEVKGWFDKSVKGTKAAAEGVLSKKCSS